MKITELGFYKARNGSKIEVTEILTKKTIIFPVKGIFHRQAEQSAAPVGPHEWTKEGYFGQSPVSSCVFDIVSRWGELESAQGDIAAANLDAGKTEMLGITVSSTSDERVVNNVMRHEYKVLSDLEKEFMKTIKDKGADLFNYLMALDNTSAGGSRELEIARQKIEEAVMWGVKHITK